MHSNFEGSTDSPLEKSFLSKMATKSSVVQHWQIFSCSSIDHSFPFKIRSWLLGDILVVWEILRFNPSNVVSGDTEIDISTGSSLLSQCRSSFIPFCINLSMSFDWVSAVSHLAFFCDELIFSSCDLCCFRESSLGGFLVFEFWREKPLVFGFSLFESASLVHFFITAFLSVSGSKGSESSSLSLIQVLNGVSVVAFFAFLVSGFPRGWALGETFKLIIVEFCWFLAAPYSPFVANFRLLSVFL